MCFLRTLVSRWISGVFLSSACEPLDLKQKIRHTYQRSFSPGSSYQPGLKMKICPDLLAINTHHEEDMKNKSTASPEGKDRIQIIRIPCIRPTVHLICRHSRATVGLYAGETVCFVLSTKSFSSSTKYKSFAYSQNIRFVFAYSHLICIEAFSQC